jgi:UDP-N-acetylmuramoyl-tripeptide--D-alanyl-D-alanine ligase
MGMNHPGEIDPLSRLARPHAALVTNVEAVHLGPMGSLEAIADAKAEIFAGLEPNGTAIINTASNGVDRLRAKAPQHVLTFSGDGQADATLLKLEITPAGSVVTAHILNATYNYFVPLAGAHHAVNSLGVMLAVAALGGNLEQAAVHYSTLPAVPGRGDASMVRMPFGAITLIDETHNASPVAVKAALKVLAMAERRPGARRIAVLGDMLELGSESAQMHRDLAPDIVAAGVDQAYLSGCEMGHLFEALPKNLRGAHAADSTSLIPALMAGLKDGDVVLVKGSRGSKMKIITEALRHAV